MSIKSAPAKVIPQHGDRMPHTTHEMIPQKEMVQRPSGKTSAPRNNKSGNR